MSRCARVRDLFGAYWDDETTRAEREWVDAHFAQCASCRAEYEALALTLGAVAALPRAEAAPDLAARSLAAARRAPAERDVVYVRPVSGWVPLAAAAALVLVAGVFVVPQVMRSQQGGSFTHSGGPVAEPRLVAVTTSPGSAARGSATAPSASGPVSVAISDTLFDHSEDVDFVLDPVTLRRGHAHTVSRLSHGIQAEQAVITF
jgi:anti-sigma factor RsiW